MALIIVVACQASGDALREPAASHTSLFGGIPIVPNGTILNVQQSSVPNQIVVRFSPGTSESLASAIGKPYGLQLVDGQSWGPFAPGRFVFEIPQVDVVPDTPTTARIYFPSFMRLSDRRTYLTDNHLALLRWRRANDGGVVAYIRLPAESLRPQLTDEAQGLFRVTLLAGLDESAVADWATAAAIQVINYDPTSGVTIVRPNSWTPPAPRLIYPVAGYSVQNPVATVTRLWVQFGPGVSTETINALAQQLRLGVVGLTAANFATLSVDPTKSKTAIQLLSDSAVVECVGVSPDPCAASTSPSASNSLAAPQQFDQPASLNLRLADGVLVLDWSEATGATAYVIFRSPAPGGPYELVAVVASAAHTYEVTDITPLGGSTHYQVMALHPCSDSVNDPTCDVPGVPYVGVGTAPAVWMNPLAQTPAQGPANPNPSPQPAAAPAPVIASPAPIVPASPAPIVPASPAPIVSASPAPIVSASPAPIASASPAPIASASPAPIAMPSPAPTASASPAPIVSASPAPIASASPAPIASASPAPIASASPAPIASAGPAASASASQAPIAPPAESASPSAQSQQPPAQTQSGPLPLASPEGLSAEAIDGHVNLSWQLLPGATSYRVYRAAADGPAFYIANTSDLIFTDTGGAAGTQYKYEIAAVAASGLVGSVSSSVSAVWQRATSSPVVLRSLPAEVGTLAGKIRFQVDARSGDGRGAVQWHMSGPAANLSIGSSSGQPIARAHLSWTSALTWDTSLVPDGTYSVTATVGDISGHQATSTSKYRIQNGAPSAPNRLSAIAQSGGVALTWEQPASETTTEYRLFRDQATSGTPLVQLSADRRSYVDTAAAPGSHSYTLVVLDMAGHSSSPTSIDVTVGSVVSPPADSAIDLQLVLPTGQALASGGRVTDTLLLISPAKPGLTFELTADGTTWRSLLPDPACSDVCSLNMNVESLAPGPYGVRAVTPQASGPTHTFIREVPTRYGPPMALAVQFGGLGALLSWSAPASTFPASYQVMRRTAGEEWRLLDTVRGSTYIDANAPSEVTVGYEIKAVDAEGNAGLPSSEVSISVPATQLGEQEMQAAPRAPTDVEVVSSHGRANLRWRLVSEADAYLVERQLEPDGPFAVAGVTGGETFVDVPATSTGQVTYRVVPISGVTQGAPSEGASALVIPASPPTPMTAATQSTASPTPAPTTPKAAVQGDSVQLSWAPAAGTAPSTTYSVYRLDQATGVFNLAASGLNGPTFTDSAVAPGGSYGYVVTAASPTGVESSFSPPLWVSLAPVTDSLSVNLLSPTQADAQFANSESLRILAQVTAAAGLAGISFSIAPQGGLWAHLPAVPADPRPLVPSPALGTSATTLWGSTLNTTSLAPGSYQLRAQASDRAGRSQEQVVNLTVGGPGARGPPSFALNATAIPGGVHLQWSDGNPDGFLLKRSVLGAGGPFETVASPQAQQYDDLLAIPGYSYAYQLMALGANVRTSFVAKASPMPAPLATTDGGPSIQVGAVSQTELSVTVTPASSSHTLTSGLHALGASYEVNAVSLATDQPVHHLGEQARVSFALPPGLTAEAAASAVIYHWDDSSGAWVEENSTVDPSLTSVTATINHLSQFVVASGAPPAGGGSIAQPPAPPTDSTGSQSPDPTLHLPSPPTALQVAADGEVVSLRKANSRVYKKADGTFQQTISAGVINYQDAAGAWQKIDSNLVQDGAGSSGVHNAANSFRIDLPAKINERAISLIDGSAAISMSLVGAAASPLVSSGNRATYAAALSGTDAEYDIMPNGLKESLVITHRSGQPPVFAFDLTTGSLVLQRQPDGSVLAVDASGQVKFIIHAPWMYDAAATQTDHGTMSHQVAVALSGGSGSYRLTYAPDATWLNDPSRRYPVTLDPSFAVYGSGYEYDDQINTYAPDYNYHGYTYLPIGYTYYSSPCCASAPSRAEVQFTNFLLDGYYASSATFYMYQYTNYGTQRGNCCTLFYATAPTSAWSYTGVTWNNQPGVTGAYASAYALANAGWVAWNVTSLVQAWQTHALGNNGIMVYANAENGPYNNNEMFYGGNGGSGPELSVTYDSYSYTSAVALPTKNILPNGGSTPVEVVLSNVGTATWGTDTRLSYRWWSGGSAITSYSASIYVPYAVPANASVDLRFNLSAPALTTTGPVYLQMALRNNSFWFSSLAWGSPSYSCDQFYYTALSCSTGTAITLADESGTLTWQGPAQVVTAAAGSLLSIPITLTNTSTATGRNYTWHAYDAADLIRVGIRDYRSVGGAVGPLPNLPNLRTYLPSDVGPQGSVNLSAVVQAPGEPGDYLLRIDLVHETPATTIWFADQGNAPLEVRARILAPADDKTSQVPVSLGDGSALGINTSNGFAAVVVTDLNIPERGSATLQVSRGYNGVNALLSSAGTSATSSAYGAGWTFSFQRSVHLGSLGTNTYDPASGILTDAQGRAWTIAWNAARGLYEDAAGNRTVSPTSAQVTTASGAITIPGLRPVDLLNGSGAIVADATAPGGYALRLEATAVPPTALVMPSGLVPVQQNGTIEFWFRPNFDMSLDAACHVFFGDALMRFGLAWNCTTQAWGSSVSKSLAFFTYDGDSGTYNTLASAAITWAGGTWHHISLTWAEGGAKQLMTDTAVVSSASHAQSPTADLIFGYQANGTGAGLSFLNGRVAQLRIDGRVVPQAELNSDAASGATVGATTNTLFLGHFDQGSVQSSAGAYVLRNADQTTDTYSSVGLLQSQSDRYGNQVDYTWDSSGRIKSISDHSLTARSISFAYNGTSFSATDFAGRTVTYQLNGSGDLVTVTQTNQVPDPRTGVVTAQNATTSYIYGPGHLMQQMIDPRGAKTNVNYDQSYRQVVLVDNPTAYWRLGETAGATATDVTGAYAAAVHSGTTLGQGGALWADPDPAYKFDGSTGYLSANPTLIGITSSLTLEAWVNHGGATWSASHEMVVSLRGSNQIYLSVFGGNIFMSVFDGTNQRMVQGGAVSTTGWHHLAGTWDGSQMRLYIDGVLSATSAVYTEAGLTSTGTTMVGSYDGTSYFFKGRLDEVAVYPTPLSSLRVQAHFIAARLGTTVSPTGYAAQVELDDPVGYWRLGESAGVRAFDQSGSGNMGKASGGVTVGQSGALASDPESSTAFDGSSGFITTGAAGSLSRWTLEAWINPSAGQTTDAAVVSDVYSTLINYVLFFNPTGSTPLGLVAGFYDGAGWHYTAPVNVRLGSWSHVAATYDGAQIRVYIDGTQLASLSYAASPVSNGLGLRIGRRWDLPNYFAGNIAEVAIYPTALTQARLQAHYAAGRTIPVAGSPYPQTVNTDTPLGYWRLGETSGTTAVDSSGAGRSGSYVGGFTLAQAGAIANDADYATIFNGSNAYVSLGNPTAFQVNAGTLEAWVNTTTSAQSAILSKLYAWWLGIQTSGKLGLYDMTAGVMRDSGVVINDGRWHQVAAVFQSGVAGGSQMYVDGKAAGSPFLMTVANQTVEVEVAGYSTTSQFLNGAVDEVALYPAVLSAGRILSHYQASRLGPIQPIGSAPGSYSANVAADGPVGLWRLDEPSGSVAQDRSGSNNTGSYSATGVTLAQPAAMATDGALTARFDGAAGYVSIPASASLNVAGPLTIEAWISKPATATGPIAEFNNGSAVGVHMWDYNTSDALYVNFVDTAGGTHNLQSAGGFFVLNTWYEVAAVYDGAYGSLYVDGQLVARTYLGAFTPQTSYPLYIARRPSGSPNYYLNSGIADVAIYPYALPASRLLAHYNASWDFTQSRVAAVQDARGITIASFTYNDSAAITQVIDGRGLPSYFSYQASGGRTLANTDSGNNVTSFQYDGAAPYQLKAMNSPTVLNHYTTVNPTAPVGQQGLALMQDDSGQPRPTSSYLMNGSYPDQSLYGASTLYTTSESWIWDSTVTLRPGVQSHRSTPGVGTHQHYLTFANALMIPAGTTVSQWIYLEPGAVAPSELELQFQATDSTGWNHRAAWGTYGLLGTFGCPSNCPQGPVPVIGRWVQLTASLGPAEGATPQVDVDVAGRLMNGIAFTVYGGTGAVWWGPTMLTFPGGSISDPSRTITRNVYNPTNDQVATVDPNGIATVKDIDPNGLKLASSTGVEPSGPAGLFQDNVSALGTTAWQQEFGYAGTSAAAITTTQHNGIGSLSQTHSGPGLQSDLYKDVAGFSPGTYARVSVWVQTASGVSGAGGASLMVENHLAGALNIQRRSASVQTAGQWAQLTLPFLIDGSGQLRIHLWHENFQGTTTWADLHVDDLSPAPDVTLQHPLGVFASGFEVQPDTSWTLGTATALNDATQAHGGQYSIKDTLTTSTSSNTVSHTVSLPLSATYRLSAWVRTVVSGGHGGAGGVQLCAQFTSSVCYPSTTTYTSTEGQWQQLTLTLAGSGTLTLQLIHTNWQGDVFWDDVGIERVADSSPSTTGLWQGTGWTGTVGGTTGAAATWSSSWSGGLGGGPSRQVTITSGGATTDIADALTTTALRTNASYVVSLWATNSASGSTITLAVAGQILDFSAACVVYTTPTLCQNSFTYSGADRGSTAAFIYYGGQGARVISISHPLIALASDVNSYTQYGQLSGTRSIFGQQSRTDYGTQSLYPIDTVQLMSLDYHRVVLADAPLAYWPLEDATGATALDLAGTHPLTVTGSLAGAAVVPSLPNTHSLITDGVAASQASSSSVLGALTDTNGQSIELWAFVNGLPPGSDYGFASAGTGTNPFDRYSGDGTPYPTYFENSRHHFAVQMPTSGVHHVVYTRRSGGRYRMYLDGSLVGDDPAGTFAVPGMLYLGGNGTYLGFKGNIADAAIYNSELSAAQVGAHYQAGLGGLGMPAAVGNYPSEVMVDAPAAYWRLGETGTSATVSDISGGADNGNINGTIARGASGALPGDPNTAMNFDGTSGYINAGDVASARFTGLSPFSVDLWVNPTAIPVNSWPRLVSKELVASPRQGWTIWVNDAGSGGYVGFERWNNGSSDYVSTAPASLPLGVWTHVVTTWDGASERIYLNGSLSAVAAGTQNIASNTYPLMIGATNGPQAFFHGSLQDVAIYPSALPAARATSHYQSGTAAAPSPGAPSLVTSFVYNALGQVVLSTRIAPQARIASRRELDSFGRVIASTANYVPGANPDSQTNVRSGTGYDVNGHVTDSYSQGTQAGTWVDAHTDYDGNGNAIDRITNYISGQPETASQNVTTRMTYDAMNELTDVASPQATAGGSTLTHTIFDTTGREAQSIVNYTAGGPSDYQTNVTTTTTYDSDGRLLTTLKPMGAGQVPTVNSFDILGRMVRQVVGSNSPPAGFAAATAQTDWTLDAGGRITDLLGPGTGSPAARYDTHYDLDDLGRKLAVIEGYGCSSPCVPATTRTIYDSRGATVVYSAPTQQLPNTGSATRTEVDLIGHALRTIQDWQSGAGASSDLNVATSYAYDGFGRVTGVTDPLGIVRTSTYDPLDRHVTVTLDPGGLNLAKTSAYSLAGDLVQVTTPRDGGARTDEVVFDALHRPVTLYQNCVNCLTGGAHDFQTNVETDTSYDSAGRVLTKTDAMGRVTRTDYDHLGRKIDQIANCNPSNTCAGTMTFDQNVKTSWTVDSSGVTLTEVSPRTGGADNIGLTTAYGYDLLGNLVSVVADKGSAANGHLNLSTTYGYDPSGNLVSMTDPGNHATTYTMDQFGQISKVTDAVGNVIQTNRSLAGEVTSIVNGRGKTNAFTLDRLGRVLNESYFKADGISNGTITYSYDAAGNRTIFADSDVAATNVTFDNAGRISQVSGPAGSTSYTYFLDGAQHTVTDITGTTTFTEDRLGRIATAQDPLETSSTVYTLDALGRMTARAEASGITTTAAFSGIDQLNSKTEAAGSTFASWTNLYDLAGNRYQETSVLPGDTFVGTATFGYDTAQRLSSASQPTQSTLNYGYDPASDRTSVSGGIAPRGSTSFAYLVNNALNTETPTGQSQIAYAPDADGNITRDAAGHYLHFDSLNRLESIYDSANTTLLVGYTYDALGRLTSRNTSGGGVTFAYRGVGQEVVSEVVGGSAIRNYAVDSRGRSLAVQIVGTGTYTLLSDPHGDVVALATGTGAIQGWVHYDPWGQVLGWGGAQIPFGYQDAFTEPVNGYVRMGVRWYDPRQGRFVTTDPAALSADRKTPLDRQLWLYALDSPLDYADITGLSSCAWWDAVCKAKEAFNAATNALSNAVTYVTNAASDAGTWISDRATDAYKWIKDKGSEAAKWVSDRLNDAQGIIGGITRFVQSRASAISRTLRTGAAAARSWAGRNLPKAAAFAKSGLSKVAEKASWPLVAISFGFQVYDNMANKHESLGEALTRAALDTAGGLIGAVAGVAICGALGVGDAATFGLATVPAAIICGGAVIGLTAGGSWLGDKLGDWIFSPHPMPPGYQCKNIVQFRCTYSPPTIAA